MRTNIEIDDALMLEAQEALGFTTKKATVDLALRTALRLKRQEEILGLVDKDTFWPGYDPEEGEPGPGDRCGSAWGCARSYSDTGGLPV